MRGLALLFFVTLIACGSTDVHVVESPSRRFGGTFFVSEIAVGRSPSSRKTHERVGFRTILEFEDAADPWAIISLRLRADS